MDLTGLCVSEVPKCAQCCAWEHVGYPPAAGFWVTNYNSSAGWPACAEHAAAVDSGWTVELHPFGEDAELRNYEPSPRNGGPQ